MRQRSRPFTRFRRLACPLVEIVPAGSRLRRLRLRDLPELRERDVSDLPELPFEPWEPTKEHSPSVDADRGQGSPGFNSYRKTTGGMRALRRHPWSDDAAPSLRTATSTSSSTSSATSSSCTRAAGAIESFALEDGLSVAAFHDQPLRLPTELGIEVEIEAKPYGLPSDDPVRRRHRACLLRPRRSRALLAGASLGRLDAPGVRGLVLRQDEPRAPLLARLRPRRDSLLGRRAPETPNADPVTREAYSHEVISFGFWPGDQKVRGPTSTPTPRPSPPAWRTSGSVPARRAGSSRTVKATSRSSPMRRCEPRTTRARPCSTFSRAPTTRAPYSPAGTATRFARPGARRRLSGSESSRAKARQAKAGSRLKPDERRARGVFGDSWPSWRSSAIHSRPQLRTRIRSGS